MIEVASLAVAGGALFAGLKVIGKRQTQHSLVRPWLKEGQAAFRKLTDGQLRPLLAQTEGGSYKNANLETMSPGGEQRIGLTLTPEPFAEILDKVKKQSESRREEIQEAITTTYTELDQKYQKFMVKHVDPIFGRKRSAQLIENATGEEVILISSYEKTLNRSIALSFSAFTAVALGSWLFPPSLFVTVPASFLLTLPIYKRAYYSLRKERRVNYHVLSGINVIGIWLGGFFVPATLGGLVYYLAEKLLMITQDRSYKGLANIFGQQPKTVWVISEGVEVEIGFDQVRAGDVVVVQAGQMVPVDGVIIEGLASVDQHMLTGEAQPVEKTPGDTVFASTILLAGRIQIQVEKAGNETVAAQIGAVLNRTASYQMALQSKGSAIAHQSALPTLILGAVAWPLIGLEQGLAILNSGFGLNIRLTAPITMLNFLNLASHSGILVKDGRSLELLSEVDTVVFDKTGTLTLEQPHVVQIHTCSSLLPETVLCYAAAAEHRQPHPIARAILEAAAEQGVQPPEIEDAHYEVGYGIKVRVGNKLVAVGSDRFMRLEEIAIPEEIQTIQSTCQAQGHSLVMVAVDHELAGAIALQPTLRPEAQSVIEGLHKRGLSLVIISGDQEEPTRKLAQQLNIDHYFANTLPENKALLVEQLQQDGKAVCFVGDGINDSIALKKANVSVSLRGATAVATDTAQIVLMDQSLQQLTQIFELADRFDKNLKVGFASAIVPGLINIGGIFLFHWGIYTSMLIYNLSLLNNLGIAMMPLLNQQETPIDTLSTPVAAAE